MICDICKSRNATVRVKKMSAGMLADHFLCAECAMRFGYAKKINRFYSVAPDFPSSENAGEVIGKKTCGCQYPELREKFSQYLADHSADYCRYRQIGSGNHFFCSFVGICRCGYRYGTFRKLAEFCGWTDCLAVPSFQGR